MYLPTSITMLPTDSTVDSTRPASRAEIIARSTREERKSLMLQDATVDAHSRRGASLVSPILNAVDNSRRALSRWLISAGQHIGPEAA